MAKNEKSATMRQYNDLKAKHPEAIVLFRCGDFYETYQEDAKECAKILGITLTWRTPSKRHAPGDYTDAMVVFPHHALDAYLPKFIRAGKRVAICDQLPDPPKKPAKRGITELTTNNSELTTNNSETMKPETLNMKPTMAADLIGKTIILGATGANYVVNSVNGDKLECDFSNGKGTIPMGVPVSQAQKFLASGTWKIGGLTPDPSPKGEGSKPETRNLNAEGVASDKRERSGKPETKDMSIRTEADVAEVDDILPVVTPKKEEGGLTPDPSPKGEGSKPETRNQKPETKVKPETKAKPAPNVKPETRNLKPETKAKPETKSGKLTYSTYDVVKKNKETGEDYTVQNAKIVGFDLTDAAYLAGASFNGGLMPETIDGKQVGTLRFSHKWREAAKAICDKLNAGGTVQDCVAIIEQAKADRKQKINERIQKRAERKAKREERKAKAQTSDVSPQTSEVYTKAELAEWLRKLNAGTDKEKAEAAKFFNDLAKAA